MGSLRCDSPPLQGGGRRFDPCCAHHFTPLFDSHVNSQLHEIRTRVHPMTLPDILFGFAAGFFAGALPLLRFLLLEPLWVAWLYCALSGVAGIGLVAAVMAVS